MVDRIMRIQDVAAALTLTKSSVYAMVRKGTFPKGIAIGVRARGWPESVVGAWIASRPAPDPVPVGRRATKVEAPAASCEAVIVE